MMQSLTNNDYLEMPNFCILNDSAIICYLSRSDSRNQINRWKVTRGEVYNEKMGEAADMLLALGWITSMLRRTMNEQ